MEWLSLTAKIKRKIFIFSHTWDEGNSIYISFCSCFSNYPYITFIWYVPIKCLFVCHIFFMCILCVYFIDIKMCNKLSIFTIPLPHLIFCMYHACLGHSVCMYVFFLQTMSIVRDYKNAILHLRMVLRIFIGLSENMLFFFGAWLFCACMITFGR